MTDMNPAQAETGLVPPKPAAGPPRVWTVFLAFALVVPMTWLLQTLVILATAMVHAARQGLLQPPIDQEAIGELFKEATVSPATFLTAIGLSEAALIGAALLLARLSRSPGRLRGGAIRLGAFTWVLILVGFLAFSNVSDMLFVLLDLRSASLEQFSTVLRSLSWPVRVVGMLVMGLGPGFGEELFFRGYMQTRLSQRWGRWVAIVIAALCFGIMHLDPVHATFAFSVGLFLGWLTERTGSIRPAIAAHACNNAVWVLTTGTLPQVSEGGAVVLLALSVVLSAAAILLLRRALPASLVGSTTAPDGSYKAQ